MASRPVFVARIESMAVAVVFIDFTWHPGYSVAQKTKSIQSLHQEARSKGICNLLEVSSKSEVPLGVALSAFNLKTKAIKSGKEFSVESAFQGSKVFEKGGPYADLIYGDSRAAKKDARLKTSGHLLGFDFMGIRFPLMPFTFFYDWLYINTLLKNPLLVSELDGYDAFTDIEYNPKKSLNCQAFSLALFTLLHRNKCIVGDKVSPDKFKEITNRIYAQSSQHINIQARLALGAQ